MELPFRLTLAYVYILFYATMSSWIQNRKPSVSSLSLKMSHSPSLSGCYRFDLVCETFDENHQNQLILALLFISLFTTFFVFCFVLDHCVHYYDLRNTKQPIMVFKGHRKAVSYAKFVSGEEIVSA